jgi:ornithine--oxo-acid transaminase
MLCIQPGEHGSTYGGSVYLALSNNIMTTDLFPTFYRNPLGCALALTALDILVSENLVERAQRLGEVFRKALREFKHPMVKEVRGRGLLNAMVIDESKSTKGRGAWQLCLLMKDRGVLAKPTHRNM